MTAIVDLSREQRAVLSLVLGKGRSYAQIASLLAIDEQAVRERAHAALAELAPRDGTPPPPARRTEVGDYLLGQQDAEHATTTVDYLQGSAVGRAWARSLAAELRGVAAAALPEIPSGGGTTAPLPTTPARREPAKQSTHAPSGDSVDFAAAVSRRGGAVLLAAVAAVAVLVLALTGVFAGGGHRKPSRAAASSTTPAPPPKIVGQVNLKPPRRGARALGVATLLQQGTAGGIYLQITGLQATAGTNSSYAAWLYNSRSSAEPLAVGTPVKSDGKIGGLARTPADIANYRALILTRETTTRPTRPGAIILSGQLPKQG